MLFVMGLIFGVSFNIPCEDDKTTNWYKLGVEALENGQYEKAIECFDFVLKLNPNYSQARDNKNIALEKLDRY